MTRKITFTSLLLLGIFIAFNGCKLDEKIEFNEASLNLPGIPLNYSDSELVSHLSKLQVVNATHFDPFIFDNQFINHSFKNPINPEITDDGATLGRVLFYDPKLSLNNSIACASCHNQSLAFADGLASSKGFGGKSTPRNSMSIVNVVTNRNLFWDSREQSVTGLVLRPIQNHIEMGMESLEDLEAKLAVTDYYPELFKKAYGSEDISAKKIADAMAQFLCSMVTANSKFDQGFTNNFEQFSTLEKMGKDLFFSKKHNVMDAMQVLIFLPLINLVENMVALESKIEKVLPILVLT